MLEKYKNWKQDNDPTIVAYKIHDYIQRQMILRIEKERFPTAKYWVMKHPYGKVNLDDIEVYLEYVSLAVWGFDLTPLERRFSKLSDGLEFLGQKWVGVIGVKLPMKSKYQIEKIVFDELRKDPRYDLYWCISKDDLVMAIAHIVREKFGSIASYNFVGIVDLVNLEKNGKLVEAVTDVEIPLVEGFKLLLGKDKKDK